jgi:hypothetical protein
MPNMPKQAGDAVLNRDGTVKVDGVTVGVWWLGTWEGVMRMITLHSPKGKTQ